jgi:hypothetical protein
MKYQSPYSPDKKVTAAQYIAEIMCEKRAASFKTDLPVKFWNLPEWCKFYKKQIFLAYPLLKKYDERAIIKALRDDELWNVYSLGAKWIIPVIEKYEKIVKQKDENTKNVVEINRKVNNTNIKWKKKSILDELD